MRKSEKYEFVAEVEHILHKAYGKYEELLKEEPETKDSDLSVTVHDSLRNLIRKTEACLDGNLDIDRLVSEFVFEKNVLEGESEISEDAPVRMRRFVKRLLALIEDFVQKLRPQKNKKLKTIKPERREYKSKKMAYFLWFIGFFGTLGLHRFYLNQVGYGFAWMFTWGILGVGAIYDLFALGGLVEEYNYLTELKEEKFHQLRENKKRMLPPKDDLF